MTALSDHTTTTNDGHAELHAELIAGLRDLADFLEINPQFAHALEHARFLQYVDDPDQFSDLVSDLGGVRSKDADDKYFGVSRLFSGIELYVYTSREQVCEAKVVGTEKVMVRDPDAPLVEIERPVVEWDCKPVLKGRI